MTKALLAACALMLVAGCGSSGKAAAPVRTVTVTSSPSISWDLLGRRACESAAKGEDLTAETDARISGMPELNGLGDYPRVRAWCAEHFHG